MEFEADDSGWPIVVTRLGEVSERTMVQMLGLMDQWIARGERFGLIIDLRGTGGLTPEARAMVVRHIKENGPLLAKLYVQAAVSDTLRQRTLYFAMQLLAPPPFPSKVFKEIEPARAWLSETLGIAATPGGPGGASRA